MIFLCLSFSFRDTPNEFVQVLKVAFPRETTLDTPKLNGFPLHVLLMAEMEDIKTKFNALQVTIKSDMVNALDERGVGASEFHTNSVLKAIKNNEERMLCCVQFSEPSSNHDNSGSLNIINDNNVRKCD